MEKIKQIVNLHPHITIEYENYRINLISNYTSIFKFINQIYEKWGLIRENSKIENCNTIIYCITDKKTYNKYVQIYKNYKKTRTNFFGVPSFCIKYMGKIIIYSELRKIMFIKNTKSIIIIGSDKQQLNFSITSMINLIFSSKLIKEGFVISHSASFSKNEKGFLILGKKGAGKTTTLLTSIEFVKSLSNDRCYIKHHKKSIICKVIQEDIPIGLQFIEKIGWSEKIKENIRLQKNLHPATKQIIFDKILKNNFNAIYRESGREYKYFQFFNKIQNVKIQKQSIINYIIFPNVNMNNEPSFILEDYSIKESNELFFQPNDELIFELISKKTYKNYNTKIKTIIKSMNEIPKIKLRLSYDIKKNKSIIKKLLKQTL